MRTLSDDLTDGTTEPEEEREPEMAPPGALQRAIARLPAPLQAGWRTIQAHPGWVVAFGVIVGYLILLALRGLVTA